MKMEKLANNRYELYNFESNAAYCETDVAIDLFVLLFIIFMFRFFY